MSEVPAEEIQPARRSALRRVAQACVVLLAAPLLAAALLSLASPAAWWLDLLTHFRPQYAMGLAGVAILQALIGPRVLAAAWGTGSLLSAALVSPYFLAGSGDGVGPELSIAHANVAGDDVDVEALARWVAQTRPDLLSLQEISSSNLPRIEAALRSLEAGYELLAAEPRSDTRGVALFSRRQGVEAGIIHPTPDKQRPMVEARMDLGDLPVAIAGFHTTRPAPGRAYRFQAEGMSAIALWSTVYEVGGAERVLIGDFNSTSQGALVSDLCDRASLRDARHGNGMAGTWPAHLPAALRIPIDGAFISAKLVATRLETGPFIGSDHLPVLVVLQARERAG